MSHRFYPIPSLPLLFLQGFVTKFTTVVARTHGKGVGACSYVSNRQSGPVDAGEVVSNLDRIERTLYARSQR